MGTLSGAVPSALWLVEVLVGICTTKLLSEEGAVMAFAWCRFFNGLSLSRKPVKKARRVYRPSLEALEDLTLLSLLELTGGSLTYNVPSGNPTNDALTITVADQTITFHSSADTITLSVDEGTGWTCSGTSTVSAFGTIVRSAGNVPSSSPSAST